MLHSCCSGGVCHADLRHLNSDRARTFLPILVVSPRRELISLELPRFANSACAHYYLVIYVDSLSLVIHVDNSCLHSFPFLFWCRSFDNILGNEARRRRLVSE